ncbi:immune-associated nucleotide-binding protein 2-like [Hypomesus transpacificus]|uniref:immune-associated nucleotide-binding protein 2-like n=1 Tax=Hypomesus transpacificus TaxID=137520 RepID=UPI001F0843B3|nr:immune-associated nucleotide-binding protein 2-like [Hypomesus transpacificus]XP_046896731.1 immune-associated nucleotide-binding protein 2-like [Hypomesus transpacificus]XP_046896732.1 immune-associated nucleotide-binding protein 2-like [Hypomesus transpacificus]
MGSCACKQSSSSNDPTELNIVLIGSHSAGKNTVGNIILGRKTFPSRQSNHRTCVKKVRHVNNCLITIVRTPGWYSLENIEKKTKDQIKESLFENGTDAFLLVVDLKSKPFDGSEQKMLESLLTARVWNHTVVVFTNEEAVDKTGRTIKEYVDYFNELIQKCGGRYVVLKSGDESSDYDQGKMVTDVVKSMKKKNHNQRYLKETLPKVQIKTPADEEDNTEETEVTRDKQGETLKRKIPGKKQTKGTDTPNGTQQFIEMNSVSELTQSPVTQDKCMKKPRGHDIDENEWTTSLCQILDELLEDDIKKFKLHLQTGHKDKKRVPAGALEKADKVTLVQLLLKYFGANDSVTKTRDALKFLPRNDLKKSIMPFLSKLGETW